MMRSSARAPSSASGASSTGCSEILSRRNLECEDARVTDAGDSEDSLDGGSTMSRGDLQLGADEAGPTTPPQPSPPPLVWSALASSALSPLAGSVSSSSSSLSADNSPGLRGAFQDASKLGEGSGGGGGPGGVSHMQPLDFATAPQVVHTVDVRTDGEVLRRRPRFLSAETDQDRGSGGGSVAEPTLTSCGVEHMLVDKRQGAIGHGAELCAHKLWPARPRPSPPKLPGASAHLPPHRPHGDALPVLAEHDLAGKRRAFVRAGRSRVPRPGRH